MLAHSPLCMPLFRILSEKSFSVRKIPVRNSGAGSRGASIYGRLEKCALPAGKTHVHKIPRLRGGLFWFWFWGECRFYFMGARIFQLTGRESSVGMLGVPKPGCFNLVVCNFYTEALFCTLLRPALLRSFADLRLRSFALICALLRAFACFCK